MNEEAVNKRGAAPLHPLMQLISQIGEKPGEEVVGKLHRAGVNAFFGLGAVPDFDDPDLNIAFMVQAGLGMPDRDYYVSDDPKKQEPRVDPRV